MHNICTIFGGIIVSLAVLIGTSVPMAHAAELITAQWDHDATFTHAQFLPGDVINEDVVITSVSNTSHPFYFELTELEGVTDAQRAITFSVTDKVTGTTVIKGQLDRIAQLQHSLGTLTSGAEQAYILTVEMPAQTQNILQGEVVTFTMNFGVTGEEVDSINDNKKKSKKKRQTSSSGSGEILKNTYGKSAVQFIDSVTRGTVLGALDVKDDAQKDDATQVVMNNNSMECVAQLVWWHWSLLLMAFLIVFNFAYIIRAAPLQHHMRIIALIGAVSVWFLYDTCHDTAWFLAAALIITLISLISTHHRHKTK